MELSELRQRWQQAAAAPQPPAGLPDETALCQLLSRGAKASPVAKLERNMWLEIAFVFFIIAAGVVALPVIKDAFWHTWLVVLLVTCGLTLPYYARKRQLIRRLNSPHGSVREHTRRQVSSIRRLMRLYYRFTMWSLVPWMGMLIFHTTQLFERQLHGPKVWLLLSILGGAYLLIGTLLYFATRSFTRQWLQKLYGQHLDQLEASLAELEEPVVHS